jgi:hypothetical protein
MLLKLLPINIIKIIATLVKETAPLLHHYVLRAEENYVFNRGLASSLEVEVSSCVTLAYFRIGKFSHKYKMCAISMELFFEIPKVIGN